MVYCYLVHHYCLQICPILAHETIALVVPFVVIVILLPQLHICLQWSGCRNVAEILANMLTITLCPYIHKFHYEGTIVTNCTGIIVHMISIITLLYLNASPTRANSSTILAAKFVINARFCASLPCFNEVWFGSGSDTFEIFNCLQAKARKCPLTMVSKNSTVLFTSFFTSVRSPCLLSSDWKYPSVPWSRADDENNFQTIWN